MAEERLVEWLRSKHEQLVKDLSERARRHWAAVEAMSLGRGGITAVAEATGISDRTIRNGIRELQGDAHAEDGRQRRAGGGRKRVGAKDRGLLPALESLVEPATRGEPQSPLKGTSKSTRELARELKVRGHGVGRPTVGKLLKAAGYSLQANRKTIEGNQPPERDAPFQHLSRRVTAQQRADQPALSGDTKKKENIGKYKNPGRAWRPKGQPVQVQTHACPDPAKGKAVPYGVYDIGQNEAWVTVGLTPDTAEFAVASIRTWWSRWGRKR